MHLIPRMNIMLDFIWTLPESICEEHETSEHYKQILSTVGFEPPTPHPLISSVSLLPRGYWGSWRYEIRTFTILFTLWYYKSSVPCAKGYTENENKIIANLQFSDWYHLNTRWLTQKKKFIMSYMSITIYNIYSVLFIIVYIVCIKICFFRYCIFVLDKKSREINRKNWWFMYNPIWRHTKYGIFSC